MLAIVKPFVLSALKQPKFKLFVIELLEKLVEHGNYIVYPNLGKLVEYKGDYIRVNK